MARRSTRAEQWRRKADKGPSRDDTSYTHLSRAPLHILAFLAPLIILYEIGSVLFLTETELGTGAETATDSKARRLLADLVDTLGTPGLMLPALLLVAVLLAQHVIRRDKLRLYPRTLAVMWLEAALWTLPLLVLGQLLFRLLGGDAPLTNPAAAVAQATPSEAALVALPLGARISIAIGAGLYEELLFRLIGIAAVHAFLHDLLRLPRKHAGAAALILTSVAFAWYHSPAEGMLSAHAGFYTAAGLFFGFLYLARGLGIAVAVHVLYDLAVLVILPR